MRGIYRSLPTGIHRDVLVDLYINLKVPQYQLKLIFKTSHRLMKRWLKELKICKSRTLIQKERYGNYHAPNWRGGRNKDSYGYIVVYDPTNKIANGRDYIKEHRKVWFDNHPETPFYYVVHHLNGLRDDNRLENLYAMPRESHKTWTIVNILQERIRKLENSLDR